MAKKRVKKALGLSPAIEMAKSGVSGSPMSKDNGRSIKRVHANRKNADAALLRPHKCPTCGTRFRPARRGTIYCSEACCRRAWRAKQKKHKPKTALDPAANPQLEPVTCLYCGKNFWAHAGKGAKYCKSGCRTMATRVRRVATINAFSQHSGKSMNEALDFAELPGGVKAMQAFLLKKGLVYQAVQRLWDLDIVD